MVYIETMQVQTIHTILHLLYLLLDHASGNGGANAYVYITSIMI